MWSLPNIEQLPSQWEDSIVIPTNHAQSTNSQRLGWISLRENESALMRVPPPSLISIIQLRDTLQFDA